MSRSVRHVGRKVLRPVRDNTALWPNEYAIRVGKFREPVRRWDCAEAHYVVKTVGPLPNSIKATFTNFTPPPLPSNLPIGSLTAPTDETLFPSPVFSNLLITPTNLLKILESLFSGLS
ncbi:hypothetical protein L1887_36130 [Cichorium endivia]|nr:hypothetical protein L1887_36130 [Cichorium endivia]